MSVDARKYNFIKIPSYMSNSSYTVLSLSLFHTLLAKQDINIFVLYSTKATTTNQLNLQKAFQK